MEINEILCSREFSKWIDEILKVRRIGAFGSTEENYFRDYLRTEIEKLVEEKVKKAILYTLRREGIHGPEYDETDAENAYKWMKEREKEK